MGFIVFVRPAGATSKVYGRRIVFVPPMPVVRVCGCVVTVIVMLMMGGFVDVQCGRIVFVAPVSGFIVFLMLSSIVLVMGCFLWNVQEVNKLKFKLLVQDVEVEWTERYEKCLRVEINSFFF